MKKSHRWVVGLVVLGAVAAIGIIVNNSPSPPGPGPGPPPVPESVPSPEPASNVETDPDVLTAPPPLDSSAPHDTPRYSLEDAAARELIEYEVHGNGSSSGESLTLMIRSLTDDDIDVYIVPGTVFVPGNSGAQRMVAWNVVRGAVVHENSDLDVNDFQQVTSMYLPDKQVRLYAVEAYCIDFDLENPALEDAFKPLLAEPVAVPAAAAAAVAPDVRAAQLIRVGKDEGISFRGIQVAIWADHNQKTKEEIGKKFTVEDKEMDDAFKRLLSTPPPQQKQRL